jgi:hypothetical protein
MAHLVHILAGEMAVVTTFYVILVGPFLRMPEYYLQQSHAIFL